MVSAAEVMPHQPAIPGSMAGFKSSSPELVMPRTASPLSMRSSPAGRSSVEFDASSNKGNAKVKSSDDTGKGGQKGRKRGVQFADMADGGDVWDLIKHGRDSMYMRAELQRELDFGIPAEDEARRYARWCEQELKREQAEAAQQAAGSKRYSHDYSKADKVVHPKRLGDDFDVESVGDTADLFSRVEAALAKEAPPKKEKEKPPKEEKEKKTRKLLRNIIQEKVLARASERLKLRDEQDQQGKKIAVEDIFRRSSPQTTPASNNRPKPSTATSLKPTPPELPPRPPTSDSSLPAGTLPSSKIPASLLPAAGNAPKVSTRPASPRVGNQDKQTGIEGRLGTLRRDGETSTVDGKASALSFSEEVKNAVSQIGSSRADAIARLEGARMKPAMADGTYQPRQPSVRTTSVDDIVRSVQLQSNAPRPPSSASADGRRPSVASVGSTASHRLQSDIVSAELGMPGERRPSDASVLSEGNGPFPFLASRKNTVDDVVEIVAPKPRLPPIKPSDLLHKGEAAITKSTGRPTTPQSKPPLSLAPSSAPPQNKAGQSGVIQPHHASPLNIVESLEKQLNGQIENPQRVRQNTLPSLAPSPFPDPGERRQRKPSPNGLPSESRKPAPPPLPLRNNLSVNPSPIPSPRQSPLPQPNSNSPQPIIRKVTPDPKAPEPRQRPSQPTQPLKPALKQNAQPIAKPSALPPATSSLGSASSQVNGHSSYSTSSNPANGSPLPPPVKSTNDDIFSRIEADIAKEKAARAEAEKEKQSKYGEGHHRDQLKAEGKKLFGKVIKKVKEKEKEINAAKANQKEISEKRQLIN